MSTSTLILSRVLAALGGLLLAACASTGGPREVTVEFENDAHGGFRRYFTIGDLTVANDAPEFYDLRLESDRPAGMFICCNGTRNTMEVGTGDEAAFLRLVQQLDFRAIRGLPAAAESVGIAPGERPADYWNPGEYIVKPGTILAIRDPHPTPGPDGELSYQDIGALVFVKSVSGNRKLVLLVARAPTPSRESQSR